MKQTRRVAVVSVLVAAAVFAPLQPSFAAAEAQPTAEQSISRYVGLVPFICKVLKIC